MPIDFKPVISSAVDGVTGISIPQPRMLPSTLPDGTEGVEYQYVFSKDGERVGALGVLGKEIVRDTPAGREKLYTFDLTPEYVFKSLFRFKRTIGNTDDDFAFLSGVARGLVNVFVGDPPRGDPQRNVVVTSAEALAREKIVVPANVEVLAGGLIVLAENFVPTRKD